MRFFVAISTLVALLVSASLSMTHVLPMDGMAMMDCGTSTGCLEASSSPLADCLEHCLNQQVSSSPVTPVLLDFSSLIVFFAVVISSVIGPVLVDAFYSGRDAPFGKRSLLLQLRTVEIKS
jgi:hypothetical protein